LFPESKEPNDPGFPDVSSSQQGANVHFDGSYVIEKNPTVTISPLNPDNLIVLPPSMKDITIGQNQINQTPLLISSVIAGIIIAVILLVRKMK
jgi:hypothetical protein